MADLPIPDDFANLFAQRKYGANMPIPPLMNQPYGTDQTLANIISMLKNGLATSVQGIPRRKMIKQND
jgi:hypothetical protein